MNVKIKDNSDKFIKAMQEQVALGLEGIGVEAQNYAVGDCPVDTGRLRNSITWATAGGQGEANTAPVPTPASGKEPEEARPEDYETQAEPEKNAVYIGTNVEYAEVQEYGDTIDHVNGKAHFLRDALATHDEKYKAIMEAALKGGSMSIE